MRHSALRVPAMSLRAGTWQGLPVAVKTLVFSASTDNRRRALQEAALSQSVTHPNIGRGECGSRELGLGPAAPQRQHLFQTVHTCICVTGSLTPAVWPCCCTCNRLVIARTDGGRAPPSLAYIPVSTARH